MASELYFRIERVWCSVGFRTPRRFRVLRVATGLVLRVAIASEGRLIQGAPECHPFYRPCMRRDVVVTPPSHFFWKSCGQMVGQRGVPDFYFQYMTGRLAD